MFWNNTLYNTIVWNNSTCLPYNLRLNLKNVTLFRIGLQDPEIGEWHL